MQFTIHDAPRTLPHRPAVRAGVCRAFNSYVAFLVDGRRVAVQAWPHRGMGHARALARRLRRDPAGYLWACRCGDVPGVAVLDDAAAAAPTAKVAAPARPAAAAASAGGGFAA